MADDDSPRGLTPKKARAELLRELTRPKVWWDDLAVAAVILGPIVVGTALPMAALAFGHGRHGEIPAIVASLLLTFGNYALGVALIVGSFARNRPNRFARVPTLDTSRPQPSGSLVLVEGRVRPIEGTSVRGPLTGREGVWSIARLARQFPQGRRRDDRGPSGDVLTDAVAFEVLDARGHAVRVEPAEGRFDRGRSIEDDGSSYPDGVAACLARSDLSLGPSEHLRVSEVVLRAGDPITVVGVLRHGEGYRGGGQSLVLLGDDDDELRVSLGPRTELLRSSTPKPSRLPGLIAVALLAAGLALTVWIAFFG